jgi:hypothetical protein
LSRKRWWRSHADCQSRCFSREAVPACKPPWRYFCKSRRMIYLSRCLKLSRAGYEELVKCREVLCHDEIVQVACKNCDKLIAYDPRVKGRANFKSVSVMKNIGICTLSSRVAGTGRKALYAMTNLVVLTFLSLRNVPDGRRDGLGHLTVYSKDYVLEYVGTVMIKKLVITFQMRYLPCQNLLHYLLNHQA